MNDIKEYTENMFENIKYRDENGSEYWSSRELMSLLDRVCKVAKIYNCY